MEGVGSSKIAYIEWCSRSALLDWTKRYEVERAMNLKIGNKRKGNWKSEIKGLGICLRLLGQQEYKS